MLPQVAACVIIVPGCASTRRWNPQAELQVIDRAYFKGASFRGALLNNAVLSGSSFEDADLTNADFTEAYIGQFDLKKLCKIVHGSDSIPQQANQGREDDNECNYCGSRGHVERNCRKKKRDQENGTNDGRKEKDSS